MKKITNRYLILFLVILFLANCRKLEIIELTKIKTGELTDIGLNSATISSTFVDVGPNVTEYGHCWNTISNPIIDDNKVMNGTRPEKGSFSSELTGLLENTTYYVCPYVVDNGLVEYGDAIEFTTTGTSTINIITPESGDDWVKGSTNDITWSDNLDENVKIELFLEGSKILDIAIDTPSDGSYTWAIPTNLTAGVKYSIAITSVDNEEVYDVAGFFTISDEIPVSLFLIGSSTDTGWEPTQAIPFRQIDVGKFELFAHLNTDEGGMVLLEQKNWEFVWKMADGNPGFLSKTGAENIPHNGVEGMYLIKIDLNELTYLITKTDWGIAGDAMDGWTSDRDMTYEPPYTWTIQTDFTEGAFKFRANDDWLIYDFGDDTQDGILDKGGANIPIFSAGRKEVTITLHPTDGYTYTIEDAEGTVGDYNGNTYKTVKIGKQWWMAENLKVTHYANGTAISHITDNTTWGNLSDNNTDKAYCYYNNNASGEANIYGAMYTWAAASNGVTSNANPSGVQGVCPTGWHLPSDAEWTELADFLGGESIAGGKMKSLGDLTTGDGLWTSPNDGATNESGFNGHPGGWRSGIDGSFANIGNFGRWWSSTENGETNAWRRGLRYNLPTIENSGSHSKSGGYSVRCVKD